MAGYLDHAHVLGPPDAEFTLVEYGSYACPHCHALRRTWMVDLGAKLLGRNSSGPSLVWVADIMTFSTAVRLRHIDEYSVLGIAGRVVGSEIYCSTAHTIRSLLTRH